MLTFSLGIFTIDNKSSTRGSSTNASSRSSEVPKGLDEDEDMKDEPIVVPDHMFLEACHVYLCWTFTADQAARFKKMIRFAGGIHVAEYHPLEVTHVVVPFDTLDPQYVMQVLIFWISVPVVIIVVAILVI